jgi:outer membrane protein TolC
VIRDGYQWDLRLKGTWSLGKRSLYYDDELLKDDPEYFIFTHQQKYLGLFLTVPLGKNKSRDLNLYQNKSGQYKKRLDLENAVLTLDSKVRDSFQQVAYWQKQKDIAKSAYLLAKRALDIEEQKYLVGRTSLLDWQRAQEMEMQVAMDQISTEMGYFLAQVELDYVSGLLPVRWQSYVG